MASKPNPFAGKRAPPFGAKPAKGGFEQSRFDKEKPGMKEGSPADMALDRKQAAAAGFKRGGGVKRGK